MPLPAIPVLAVGAMKIYRAYQVAKFAHCAYSTVKGSNSLHEDGSPKTKMAKFIEVGKSALTASSGLVLGGKAGVVLTGLQALNTADSTVKTASKLGDLKNSLGNEPGKGLMDKFAIIKDVFDGVRDTPSKPKVKA